MGFKKFILVPIALGLITTVIITVNKTHIENPTLPSENPAAPSENPIVVDYDNDFPISFLKYENNGKNMLYSPLSIKYALNLLNEGANGNTKTEIENVIKDLGLTKYDNIENVLSLANCVYIRDTYKKYIKDEYIKSVKQKYNSEINYDSFADAKNINNWIENKTFKIIKNMVRDELVQQSKVVLINALAIDMEWKDSFDAENTHGNDFNLENGNKMIATTMHKETKGNDASYYKDENITALTMDLEKYNNTQLEFIAIMPNGNLSDYIKDFSTSKFNNIVNNFISASKTDYGLSISIPRFSFDYDLKLKEDLMKMGINDAFNEANADFTNMTNSPIGLYVSEALHKANIDFTEKGIKAAAVTVILMKDNAMFVQENKPIEIKFDKPFMYVIRDKNTGEIWFVGTVYEPNSWEKDKTDYQYR